MNKQREKLNKYESRMEEKEQNYKQEENVETTHTFPYYTHSINSNAHFNCRLVANSYLSIKLCQNIDI